MPRLYLGRSGISLICSLGGAGTDVASAYGYIVSTHQKQIPVTLLRSGLCLEAALQQIGKELETIPELEHFVAFIQTSD